MERPKRRKCNDNTYMLKQNDNHYYIVFKDSQNIIRKIEVIKKVYDLFDQFELDDLKEMNEFDRHIEHKELTDENIYSKGVNNAEDIDDFIIRKSTYEELINAINKLSSTQRRRIKLYYFDELNEYEIASLEKTSQQAINKSLNQARKNLKEFLKNNI